MLGGGVTVMSIWFRRNDADAKSTSRSVNERVAVAIPVGVLFPRALTA